MEDTKNKELVALKPVNLKKLYKSRRYENLFLTSVLICRLALLVNFVAIVVRLYLGFNQNSVEPYTMTEWGTLLGIVVLHFLIIVYAMSSIKSLQERT